MRSSLFHFTLFLCVLVTTVLSAQTIHQVAAGTDGITTALNSSAAGDIIELTTSGGTYLENNTMNITYGVTIRAASALTNRPVIMSKGQHMFQIQPDLGTADNWWFNLDGLEFNTVIDDTTKLTGKCIDVLDGTTYYDLSITDCDFKNFTNKIIWPGASTYCDTLIFNQNMLFNCSDVARMQTACAGTVTMVNNTIWINNNTSKCMFLFMFRGDNPAISEFVEPTVTIKNLTRYGGVENYPFINLSSNNTVIKNIIASNRGLLNGGTNGGQFRVTGEGVVLSNLLVDSLRASSVFRFDDIDALGSSVTIDSATLQINVDPMFEDPANGNFNLLPGSPAIGAADDGGDLGDRRWHQTVVPVELTSFSAQVQTNSVLLKWNTATELHNDGFAIERSIAQNEWVQIGFIKGHGTVSESNSYSFIDEPHNVNTVYYRLKQIDFDGTFSYSKTVEVSLNTPKVFVLEQNYPNPFNPSTKISYSIPEKSNIKISVYNILGAEVAVLINGEVEAGKHEIDFHASNLATGIYIYELINSGKVLGAHKMILMK